MTEINQQPPSSTSSIVRFWERIPIAVRAIVVGLLVVSILSTVALNLILILIPAPWSAVALVIVFWAYLKYFSGSWGPKATSESRRVRFRATKLPTRVWQWSLIAALLAAIFMQSSLVVLCRIIECIPLAPAAVLDAGLPIWQIWLFILMAAGVNGIAEEVGFRGYMQVPLEGKGLTSAVRAYAEDWSRQNGIELRVNPKHERPLPLDVEQMIFRIIQEALANVARHSQASRVEIGLIYDKFDITCTITDDGLGFDPEQKHAGFGIRSMQERAKALGSSVILESAPGKGTSISLTIALQKAKKNDVGISHE